MLNTFKNIIRPKGAWAKWLVFLMLAGILAAGAAGYFDIVRNYTDTQALSFKVGDYQFSIYTLIKAVLTLALVFWSAAIVSDVLDSRINKIKQMRASTRSLLSKIAQIFIYFIAFMIGLDILGIDLTTFAVFSGALGIGLGFGLQKIASNFISGLILLMEKSVEQDDLVELTDGTFGFIRKSGARYTLVETFDGKEIMIPNEDFITNRVTNWTFSSTRGRVEIPVGVSYGSDIKRARELMLEAAREHPRCIEDPEPQCFLRNFGDSSVDFVLFFWLEDVTAGRWGPQSEVMFAIWDKFAENDISIPFPQRDLHLRSAEPLIVKSK